MLCKEGTSASHHDRITGVGFTLLPSTTRKQVKIDETSLQTSAGMGNPNRAQWSFWVEKKRSKFREGKKTRICGDYHRGQRCSECPRGLKRGPLRSLAKYWSGRIWGEILRLRKGHWEAVDQTTPGVHTGLGIVCIHKTIVEINQAEWKFLIMHKALGPVLRQVLC